MMWSIHRNLKCIGGIKTLGIYEASSTHTQKKSQPYQESSSHKHFTLKGCLCHTITCCGVQQQDMLKGK